MDTAVESTNGTTTRTRNGESTSKAPRKQRYLPGLPSASSAKDMQQVVYTALVDRTPTEFASLDNHELFSMSDDGSFLMKKESKSKAIRLSDRKVFMTGGGRVYRVTFQSHEIKPTKSE
jgi:hypothetical protein